MHLEVNYLIELVSLFDIIKCMNYLNSIETILHYKYVILQNQYLSVLFISLLKQLLIFWIIPIEFIRFKCYIYICFYFMIITMTNN